MELRGLQYFLIAAREENITKAAQLLHLTQPTLSRQLAKLEEELGVTLFERKSHKIELTEEGRLLKRRAQELIQLSEIIKEEIATTEHQIKGTISIGAGEFKSVDELATIIHAFRTRYPFVIFRLVSGNTDSIKSQVDQGLLDLGLVIEPTTIKKYLMKRISIKERWGIYVSKQHPLANKEVIFPKDLAHEQVISTENTRMQDELAYWLGEYKPDVQLIATYNLLYNGLILTKKESAICLGLELEMCYLDFVFIPLAPEITFTTALIFKSTSIYSPTVTAFLSFLQEYLEE